MAAWLDVCRYSPTAGGTTDWTYSAAIQGYQSPTAAGVVNSTVYRYRAESSDLAQWEIGFGAYNTGTGVLARTTVLYNSSGTGTGAGQSGAGTKISFTVAPQVAIVALAEDLIGFVAKAGDTMTGNLTAPGYIVTANGGGLTATGTNAFVELGAPLSASTPFIDFHSSGNNIDYDVRMIASGGDATQGNGALQVNASIFNISNQTAGSGAILKLAGDGGTTPNKSIRAMGGNLDLINSAFSGLIATFSDAGALTLTGTMTATAYACRSGLSGSYSGNVFNLFYSAGAVQLWIDVTNLGTINVTSDYRIKKDVTDAAPALAEVLQWRPITYTGKAWGIFEDNATVRHSFIAHELQAISPDCVVGEKDGEQPQSLDLVPIVVRLTKAVQELSAEIAELKARRP